MEYQKIMNLLDNTSNQPSKFMTINWAEIKDESRGTCSTSMINFNDKVDLCDKSDAYIYVIGTITIPNTTATNPGVNNANKKVISKNCTSFTNCISEINNTKVDDAHDIDVEMRMYNLIEHGDIYSKTLGSSW